MLCNVCILLDMLCMYACVYLYMIICVCALVWKNGQLEDQSLN